MRKLCCGAAAFTLLCAVAAQVQAQDTLSGRVIGPNGPEAGVWVIAETHELPTRFARIVVTDAEGRFLVPELPKAAYDVWVRGYGLADSPRVSARAGETLELAALPATADGKALPARERPKGAARNLVITTWDWSRADSALHELAVSDRRNPRVNAHGRVYGSAEAASDLVPVLDPKTHSSSSVAHPAPGASPMLDEKRRVWFSGASRSAPAEFCGHGSGHPSAKAFPLEGAAEHQLTMYDPKKGAWKQIPTCFSARELHLGLDDDQTLWTSSGAGVLGWLNRYVYERTGDEALAQGWTPFVLDTSGDGRRGAYVEPDAPLESKKDKRVALDVSTLAVSPLDGAVWGTVAGDPGGIVRVVPGANPTFTALTEYYEVPSPGHGPRGGDVDTNGVFWISLASGHLARFERGKCKVLKGPSATGKHCPEGWTFIQGLSAGSGSTWIDWFNTLGLGMNVPIIAGDGVLHALVKGALVTLHIPHPAGVLPQNLDGRIDDERTGWKGRGLWTASSMRTDGPSEKHGAQSVVKLQLRPHPLAR